MSLFIVSGCGNLSDYRNLSQNEDRHLQQVRKYRSLAIKEGDTYYSNSLRCIDKVFDASNPVGSDGKKKKLDITAASIFDKTGAVLKSSESTALSDMALHALTKMPLYFEVVDTPNGSINNSRINYSDINNPFRKNIVGNRSKTEKSGFDITTISDTPIGVTHPTASYINGAIVQYDELSEIPKDLRSIGLNIDPVTLSRNVEVTTIGMNLRLINSSTGRIADSGSIYLTNRLVAIRKTADVFKIINDDARNADYSVVTADPRHYAVMEMMEKGIYTIFSKVINSPNQCEPENISRKAYYEGTK